MIMDQSAAK